MGATILVRLRADGSLDPSFGDGGRRGFNALPPGMRGIDALAVQSDGAIVVAATGLGGGLLEYAEDYLVARLGPSGSLDTRFGDAGLATIDFDVSGEVLHDLAIQADGRIVVAGQAGEGFAVARLGPDGTPDDGFDGDGRAVIAFADTSAARSVAIDADGRVILAGFVNAAGVTGAFGWDFAVAPQTTPGARDRALSWDGRATVEFGEKNAPRSDEAVAVVLQPEDGKIVVMGNSDDVPGFRSEAPYMFAVARLKVVPDTGNDPPINPGKPGRPGEPGNPVKTLPLRPRPVPDPRIYFFYGLSKRRPAVVSAPLAPSPSPSPVPVASKARPPRRIVRNNPPLAAPPVRRRFATLQEASIAARQIDVAAAGRPVRPGRLGVMR
ncbi:hypothetical protein HK102_009765 [Quaeritorhiza haematococci]|nr:hypothetical protein HK102_009765 [Quaeritorhiza haematococci]